MSHTRVEGHEEPIDRMMKLVCRGGAPNVATTLPCPTTPVHEVNPADRWRLNPAVTENRDTVDVFVLLPVVRPWRTCRKPESVTASRLHDLAGRLISPNCLQPESRETTGVEESEVIKSD